MSTEREHELDFMKEFSGYFKHLTTLSTGAIVLVATFLEKIFQSPEWKVAVIISLVSFTCCVLASTIAYTLMLFVEHPFVKDDTDRGWVEKLGGAGIFISWGGFVIGIASLSAFTIKNLLA